MWFGNWFERRVSNVVTPQFDALIAAVERVAPATCEGMMKPICEVPQNVAAVLDIPDVVSAAVVEGSTDVVRGIEQVLETMRRIAPFA